LNACWSNENSFKGQILTDVKKSIELLELCEFSPRDKWSLLYRGTEMALVQMLFIPNVMIMRILLLYYKLKKVNLYLVDLLLLVGNRRLMLNSNRIQVYLFSNKDNKQLKMKKDPNGHSCAIYCLLDLVQLWVRIFV
jgi:hypothetical protein